VIDNQRKKQSSGFGSYKDPAMADLPKKCARYFSRYFHFKHLFCSCSGDSIANREWQQVLFSRFLSVWQVSIGHCSKDSFLARVSFVDGAKNSLISG